MANEITLDAKIQAARGACSFVRRYSKTTDQTTADMKSEVLTINGAIALSFGLVTDGEMWVQNISENGASLELGPEVAATIHPVAELLPGELAMFRPDPAITLWANNTQGGSIWATLYYLILDD